MYTSSVTTSHPSRSRPQYGRELIGLAPWLVGPTELPRCLAVINIPVLPTFARKINNGENGGIGDGDGGERGGESSYSESFNTAATVCHRKISPSEYPHISLPLYCVRPPRSGSGHACHTQMYNSFFKSSFPARKRNRRQILIGLRCLWLIAINRNSSEIFSHLRSWCCGCREICIRQVNLDIISLNW